MAKPYPSIDYADYLRIPQLLEQQKLRSEEFGRPAHDELLFIITHQTYELWFKQILRELDLVLGIFSTDQVAEVQMSRAVQSLHRVIEIQKLLIQQVGVMETMTPLDFLDFRDMLYPASGFQSTQNRMIENKLGLQSTSRVAYNEKAYHTFVAQNEGDRMRASETEASLFDRVDAWLARTPFLRSGEFEFWRHYQGAVTAMLEGDRETVRNHAGLSPEIRDKNLSGIDGTAATFESLFDEAKYEELRKEGHFRLSYQALHAALLIQLYRDQPIFNLPFQLLTALQDIDELMTTWRYRHALMAHRMLGKKIGTGGSSGHNYLKSATDKHRIFADFFNLATYLIPRSKLPALPEDLRLRMGFTR